MWKRVEGMLWASVFGCPVLATQMSAKALLMMLAVVWFAAIALVIPLHFYTAWRRLVSVRNRREYALWVGLEALFAAGLVGSIGHAVLGTR
jgi:hypothetical protein